MVDIEPMTTQDQEIARQLIEEHVQHTRSARGHYVLATWAKRHFVKVMPHEWRRVLEARQRQDVAKVAGAHG
jgi:glutamate synthase domain-containing protein 3